MEDSRPRHDRSHAQNPPNNDTHNHNDILANIDLFHDVDKVVRKRAGKRKGKRIRGKPNGALVI